MFSKFRSLELSTTLRLNKRILMVGSSFLLPFHIQKKATLEAASVK